jgi:hypothetical protein
MGYFRPKDLPKVLGDPKPEPKAKKQPKPINKVSAKRKDENKMYSPLRLQFLHFNKVCPITGGATEDVHHKMGRIGFADDFAREENIPLLLDERFWLAVSREGHRKIEENPEWAYEQGYSIKRNTNVK